MKNFLFLSLLLSILLSSGCASKMQYGNFADASGETNQFLAEDAVRVLEIVWPPASTQFDLKHAPNPQDYFGVAFVTKLRERGYAVNEPEATRSAQELLRPGSTGNLLSYVIDRVGPENLLLRLSLFIDGQALSRVYSVSSNGTVPAGAWVRRQE